MKKLILCMLLAWAAGAAQTSLAFTVVEGGDTVEYCPYGPHSVQVCWVGKSSTHIVIPDEVEYGGNTYVVAAIANHAFENCADLLSVEIGENVLTIGEFAFDHCVNLMEIDLPPYLEEIHYAAFNACHRLPSLHLPASTWVFGGRWGVATDWCWALEAITVDPANARFSSLDGALYNKARDTLLVCPQGKRGDLSVADSVSGIIYPSWIGMPLSNVSLSSVTVDPANPWYSSRGGILYNKAGDTLLLCPAGHPAEATDIPPGVEVVYDYAFYGCDALRAATIPPGVRHIGEGAFDSCSNLEVVYFNAADCATPYPSPDYYFELHGPFGHSDALREAVFGEGVRKVPDYLFLNNRPLSSIRFSPFLTDIGNRAFEGCSSLSELRLPDSLRSIGASAFKGCTGLESLSIGSGTEGIAPSAFEGCSALRKIVCHAPTPLGINPAVFNSVSKDIPVYVPCGSEQAYRQAYGWRDFSHIAGIHTRVPSELEASWQGDSLLLSWEGIARRHEILRGGVPVDTVHTPAGEPFRYADGEDSPGEALCYRVRGLSGACAGSPSHPLCLTVGTEDRDVAQPFRLFPNPADGHAALSGEGLREAALYDLAGRLLLRAPCPGGTLRLETASLPEGVYLLRCLATDGSAATLKLVVAH